MKPGELIGKTIEGVKERLIRGNGLFEVQLREGNIAYVTCQFSEPASTDELELAEKRLGYQLPVDYHRFLTISNGCSLFDDPVYGGEAQVYRLQEALQYSSGEENMGYLKVAWIYQDEIFINLSVYNSGNPNYLYVKDHIEPYDESRPLNMNFELWLDRFIVSQGSKFWNWSVNTAENYYKLRG